MTDRFFLILARGLKWLSDELPWITLGASGALAAHYGAVALSRAWVGL